MPKKISELQSAELKYRALLNKRDEINEQAAVLRSERDSLNDLKKALQERMKEARDKRDALVEEMRVHKRRRGELQKKAKELIEFKKKLRGRQVGGLRDEIEALSHQVKQMEVKQETVPMPLPEERELLEEMKAKLAEMNRLKDILAEQDKIDKEVKNVDHSIDQLFRQADKEHEEVVRLSEESQKHHDEVTGRVNEIATLIATADKKHREFVKLKEQADAAHNKAAEMREKVVEVKRARRAERMEEVTAVKQVNLATKKALDDEEKKAKAADEALRALLRKGKLEIG